jgi:hypothetical protein
MFTSSSLRSVSDVTGGDAEEEVADEAGAGADGMASEVAGISIAAVMVGIVHVVVVVMDEVDARAGDDGETLGGSKRSRLSRLLTGSEYKIYRSNILHAYHLLPLNYHIFSLISV